MRDWDAIEGIEPDVVAWEALGLLASGQQRDVAEALRDLAEARERAVHDTELDVVDLVEFSLRRRRGDDPEHLLAPLDAVVERAAHTSDRLVEAVARAQRSEVLCVAGEVWQAVGEHARARAMLPALPPQVLLGKRLYMLGLGSLARASQMLGLDDEAADLRAAATRLDEATAPSVPRAVDHGFSRLNVALATLRNLLTDRTWGEPLGPESLAHLRAQVEVLRADDRLVDGAALSVDVLAWVVDAYCTATDATPKRTARSGLATIEWADVGLPSVVRRVAIAGLMHGLAESAEVSDEELARARWLHDQLPSDHRLRSLDLAISAERLALEIAVRERSGDDRADLVDHVLALREGQYATVLRQLRHALSAASRARCQGESLLVENSRLVDDARSDALTGAGSRQYLQELMTNLIDAEPRTTGLVIVDIDRFKAINDTFGHPVGDVVLRRASAVISDCLRSGDHVFRYGGDEFVVLLTLTTPAATAACAERIRGTIEGYPWSEIAPGLDVTVSVGAEAARDTGEELLHAADAHLLRAKGYL